MENNNIHALEHLLLILAARIRHETGKEELADAAVTFASASHDYVPEREELLFKMNDEWGRRYGKLLIRSITWSPDGSICPICRGPGRKSSRYPAALCESCQSSLVAANGDPVQLFNEDMSGGLQIITRNVTVKGSDAEKMSLYPYANQIECRAQEHRFGGVVVQPLEAWKTPL